jgi:hypothetical protein
MKVILIYPSSTRLRMNWYRVSKCLLQTPENAFSAMNTVPMLPVLTMSWSSTEIFRPLKVVHKPGPRHCLGFCQIFCFTAGWGEIIVTLWLLTEVLLARKWCILSYWYNSMNLQPNNYHHTSKDFSLLHLSLVLSSSRTIRSPRYHNPFTLTVLLSHFQYLVLNSELYLYLNCM